MKKLLFCLLTISCLSYSTAQTYFTLDLDNGIDDWTLIDADGDGANWTITDYGDGNVLSSASWDQNPLNPDNWIVSPAIDLSSGISPRLYWEVSAQDQLWPDENYTVYVSTQSDVTSLESSAVYFNEITGESDGYMYRDLDLSSFNGQTVYLAFRHHNVTDMFRLNIANVSVQEPILEQVSLDVSSIYQVVESEGETTSFDFSVLSTGSEELSGFTFNYTIDGVYNSISATQTLSFGDQEVFTVDLPLGSYDCSVSVTNSSGQQIGAEVEYSLSVVPPVPSFTLEDTYGNSHDIHQILNKGTTVILDFFASWCGPCEDSTPEVNAVWNQFGAGEEDLQVIGLTIESEDNASIVNGLGWGAEYPKMAYSQESYMQYYHYASMFQADGIPFFVMICPNTENPGYSEISWTSIGWAPGGQSQGDMEAAVASCEPVAIDEVLENKLSVFPNPASNIAAVELNLVEANDVVIEVLNTLGQKVFAYNASMSSGLNKIELPAATLDAGLYYVNITVANELLTEKLNIVK